MSGSPAVLYVQKWLLMPRPAAQVPILAGEALENTGLSSPIL